ncbi:MAG: oligosaccharide flippase family protein [Nannocystaceae bacterium]|nr:oligosaccharide flippase family protein [Nannocystaceae bacterium]
MSSKSIAGKSLGGGAWLGLAKLWFLVAGYGLNVALTHLIAEGTYGQYQTVARAVAIPNMVIIYTVMFAVSRPLSAEFADGVPNYAAIRRNGLRLAAVLGIAATGTMLLVAPVLAGWRNDDSLTAPLRVVAPISIIYALYAVNIGTLNATRRFSSQAMLDITMATLKSGFIALAAGLALGLTWIVAGFTAAAGSAFLLSLFLVARARPQTTPTTGAPPMAGFAAALILFTLVLNVLQSSDLLILSSFSTTAALKAETGYYSSAQLIAWVPYSLMNAVALVAFPLVASITESGDREQIKRYVRAAAMTAFTLLAFMSVVAAAAASEVQSLLFPSAYAAAAEHLQLLVFGFSGYSFANTVAWMCNSAGEKRAALAIVAVPLLTAIPLAFLLCPGQHAHGAAIAVVVAGGAASVAGLTALRYVFGVQPPWMHLLKLAAAVGAVFLLGAIVPVPTAGLIGKIAIVGKLSLLSATFIAVAFGTKAVTIAQLKALRRG